MWLIFALASALFAGIMSILAKIGIKDVDSNLATALRTVIVAVFAWLMVFVVGSQHAIPEIDAKTLVFLILSGLATGGSWLCYFRALQIGDVNKVVPVDKTSTVLTILLSAIFLGEGMSLLKIGAMALIGVGTYLMIEKKKDSSVAVSDGGRSGAVSGGSGPVAVSGGGGPQAAKTEPGWLFFAVLSAVFASLTAILGKVGIVGVESNLGTAIRTLVVLAMAWMIVFMQGKHRDAGQIDGRSRLFIGLSGLATGLSWLCFYRALQEGPAGVVVPIDKLSILVTIAFGYFALHEKLSAKSALGLAMIVAGTLSLLLIQP
ncbi:MAG: EamA family transporter [Clostridiales bacterium]|nr:EamA family transporter [Clostridiales bacterium]